jgi:integration host factor subunit beta
MTTTTKKDLIERIAEQTNQSRSAVKRTVQAFLDHVIQELSRGHRIEFRDFGVFEIKDRAPRIARNPRTDQRVPIPARKTVRFKIGKLMQQAVDGEHDGRLDGHVRRSRARDMDGELQEA